MRNVGRDPESDQIRQHTHTHTHTHTETHKKKQLREKKNHTNFWGTSRLGELHSGGRGSNNGWWKLCTLRDPISSLYHLLSAPLSSHFIDVSHSVLPSFSSQCLRRSRSIWPAGPGTPKTWLAAGLREEKERPTLARSTRSSTNSGTETDTFNSVGHLKSRLNLIQFKIKHYKHYAFGPFWGQSWPSIVLSLTHQRKSSTSIICVFHEHKNNSLLLPCPNNPKSLYLTTWKWDATINCLSPEI